MLNVTREEHKYLLDLREASRIRSKLESFMAQDAHNGSSGYLISSLYFDTENNRDFNSKLDGLELRRKLRLRYYPGGGAVKFEIKQKQGSAQLKRSLVLNRPDAQKLIQSDYSPLLCMGFPFADECYALLTAEGYRPKTIVQYRRLAFINPVSDVRITLDSVVRATTGSFDLFSDKLNLHPVLNPFATILEIKTSGILLSYLKDMLGTADKSPCSVSKYCLARQA